MYIKNPISTFYIEVFCYSSWILFDPQRAKAQNSHIETKPLHRLSRDRAASFLLFDVTKRQLFFFFLRTMATTRKNRKSEANVIDDVITMTPVADVIMVEAPLELLGGNSGVLVSTVSVLKKLSKNTLNS